MTNIKNFIKPIVVFLILELTTYYLSRLFITGRPLYDLSLPIDRLIPLIPWTVVIYFGCYIFWANGYLLLFYKENDEIWKFFTADTIMKVITFTIFIIFPCTINRPVINGTGLFNDLMRFLYTIDSPNNLFPSLHCAFSWMTIKALQNNRRVDKWYLYLNYLMCISVAIVTLTTKQHVFVDTIAGFLIAEYSYQLGCKYYLNYKNLLNGNKNKQ